MNEKTTPVYNCFMRYNKLSCIPWWDFCILAEAHLMGSIHDKASKFLEKRFWFYLIISDFWLSIHYR